MREEFFDFTRCVRPDGTAYGTRGRCRSGTEAARPATPASTPTRRKPQSSENAKATWQKAQKAEKTAKANLKKVLKETKGNNSPEAHAQRRNAADLLEKAEILALRASDRYFAAKKREDRSAMTSEQRRQEREWDRQRRQIG